uniref:uncharacterized protein LOC120344276 n=1 Tax=Styela clava TaxID=7725 RepID=UPI001939C2A6|nr:uncharacterized protein LOC120344276 [Styela clava]
MLSIWLAYSIILYSGITRAQNCKNQQSCLCRKQQNCLCDDYQEVACSSECLKEGTVGYLQDGRAFTCSVHGANRDIPRPTKNDTTACMPVSFRISCHKTFIRSIYVPTLNMSWDQEERFIRDGDITGFYLVEGNLRYKVSIDIKNDKRNHSMHVPNNSCIRFRYDCFGAHNDLLEPEEKMQFWVASLPMSQPDDPRNGLCAEFTIPNQDECGKTYLSTTTTTTTEEHTEQQSTPSYTENWITFFIVILGICLVIVAAVVIYVKKKKKQGQNFEKEENTDFKIRNILMVADKKKNCDEVHGIATKMREYFSEVQVICNWENRNEKSISNWYSKRMEEANVVIFVEGVEILKMLEINNKEIQQQTDFTMAINHFLFQSRKNIFKPAMFLVRNERDSFYILTMHKAKNCHAFLIKNSTDEEFYRYLESIAVATPAKNSKIKKQHPKNQAQQKQKIGLEEQEKFIEQDNEHYKANRAKSNVVHIEMETIAEVHAIDKDENGNTQIGERDPNNCVQKGARPKERTTGL